MPELIDRIAADLAAVRWPDAAEIRGRAVRRRRRRTAIVSGLATVLTITTAVPMALNRGGGDDAGPIAPAERLVEIPPEALLQPEDVGPGLISRRETGDEERPVAARRQQFTEATCPAAEPLNVYNALYRSQRTHSVRTPGDPSDPNSGNAVLTQIVVRLDDGLAAQLTDDLKRIGMICGNRVTTDTVDAGQGRTIKYETTRQARISDEGFVGDQSFMLAVSAEHVRLDGVDEPFLRPSTALQAVVRVGDLVTVIGWTDGVQPAEARRLAERAAGWLCVASNPPC